MGESTITKIVTHPGSAHMDEFLAICLAVHKTGCTQVERRNAVDADFNDPSVMVIDQGQKKHNPALNNFDHHHDPKLPSSLPLVAEKLGLDKLLSETTRWYPAVDFEDRKGPTKLAAQFGLNVIQREALADPVGLAMLEIFKGYDTSKGYNAVPPEFVTMMGKIGETTIRKAGLFKPDYERLSAKIDQIKEVDGIKYFSDDAAESPARDDFARDHEVAIVITRNGRGTGWKFSRIDDHPRVDFRNAKDLPDLNPAQTPGSFTHNNGFLAVTTNANANFEDIIKAAIIQPALEQDPPETFAAKHPPKRFARTVG